MLKYLGNSRVKLLVLADVQRRNYIDLEHLRHGHRVQSFVKLIIELLRTALDASAVKTAAQVCRRGLVVYFIECSFNTVPHGRSKVKEHFELHPGPF